MYWIKLNVFVDWIIMNFLKLSLCPYSVDFACHLAVVVLGGSATRRVRSPSVLKTGHN